jgi:hypothetical protein
MEAGIAHRAVAGLPADGSAEAVVMLARGDIDLVGAAKSLAPGGVIYAELRCGRGGGSGALRRAAAVLRDEGLSQVDAFWCRPDFERPSAYVQIDPAVIRWYTVNAMRPASSAESLQRFTLRAFRPLGVSAAAALFRSVAIVATAAPRRLPAVLEASPVPDEIKRGTRGFILLPGRNERSVFLTFTEGADHPGAAVKVANSPYFNDHAEIEQRALAAVRADLDEELVATVPRPLGVGQWRGLAVGADEGAPGRLMISSHPRWDVRHRRSIAGLRRVSEWLTRFHRRTASTPAPWRELLEAQPLDPRFRRFAATFRTGAALEAMLEAARKRSEAVADAPLALVWSHGDLHPGNVYLQPDRVHVIDWGGATRSLPLQDLLKFAEQWNNHVTDSWDGAARVRAFRNLFVDPQPVGRLAAATREELGRYCEQLRIPDAFIPLLFIITWVDLALHHTDAHADGGAPAHAKYAEVFASYVRAIAEIPGHGFDVVESWAGRRHRESTA